MRDGIPVNSTCLTFLFEVNFYDARIHSLGFKSQFAAWGTA
jgi:hypothetical protein